MRSKAYHSKSLQDHQGNQYMILDLQLIDYPEFLAFTRSSAFTLYLILRRHVWRSRKKHNLELVNQLREEGRLVSALPRTTLAKMIGVVPSTVSGLVRELAIAGVIEKHLTGKSNVFVLGEQRKSVETFFIDQPEVLENLSSGVLKKRPSEVAKKRHSNKEDNNKYNYSSAQEPDHAVIHVRI